MFKKIEKILETTQHVIEGLNNTVWGGAKGADKAYGIAQTGLSGADVIVETSHALEDLACQDYVCTTLDVIGSVSTAAGMVLGNINTTKHLTHITGSVTVCCRTVRYYCKNHGTFWGCTIAAGEGVKEAIKFSIKR